MKITTITVFLIFLSLYFIFLFIFIQDSLIDHEPLVADDVFYPMSVFVLPVGVLLVIIPLIMIFVATERFRTHMHMWAKVGLSIMGCFVVLLIIIGLAFLYIYANFSN